MKKTVLIILSLAFIICLFSCCMRTQTVGAEEKSMLQYTYANLTFSKPENENYECTVENNKEKYITVDANNEGDCYWLIVTSNKPTKKKIPVITVYKQDEKGKKTVLKSFQISVTPAKKVEMKNIKINTKTARRITLKNPYYECKEYELSYNKKILNISQYLFDGEKAIYTLEGLKKGKTTVKAYLTGTKKLIGSFKVTVGEYEAYIKENKKNVTIYYNSHMPDSRNLNKSSFDLGKAIGNYHADSVYSAEADNFELIRKDNNDADEVTPNADLIYGAKTGKTKLTVYEKQGNNKTKIGTLNLTIKKAKDSEVYASNRERDNDGIFYEFFICPGEKVDLKEIITQRYINTSFSHFEEDEYSFTFKSKNPETLKVDKNGICTCLKTGSNYVSYTVKFKDGSTASGGGSFDIVDKDFFE